MRMTLVFAVLVALLALDCSAEERSATSGTIRGTVFATDAAGGSLVAPNIAVYLEGPASEQTMADDHGNYGFESLPAGSYVVRASAQGLTGTTNVQVECGHVTQAPLHLMLNAVKTTVTVTADADPVRSDSSTQTVTINSSTVALAPNRTERFEGLLPLVPGVVRGPDGLLNVKGASSTQAGWLVNSTNVTDPATGEKAVNLPIDVVSTVQVISNPYDPEYGRFTGAVSSVETRTSNFDAFHFSIQNLFPRPRKRGGDFIGIEAFTPRATLTGPLIKDKVAFTQSFEYRFVRTPVNSLPPLQRDIKLESVDSFTQLDLRITSKQTAAASFALYPQKLDYLGLNTFTPQASAPNLHSRGYEGSLQHNYASNAGDLLTSQFSYKKVDGDVFPNSTDQYRLLVETTEGGFFNRQQRRTDSTELRETYQLTPKHFAGSHEFKIGVDFLHNAYDGHQQFSPVDVVGVDGLTLERIQFGTATEFAVRQNEVALFAGDHWSAGARLSFDLGMRFDHDSVTNGENFAPRAGLTLALTRDKKTVLRSGAGFFYDRVPLIAPSFTSLPDRTLVVLGPSEAVTSSTLYRNEITGGLRNPRSEVWNVEVDRQISGTYWSELLTNNGIRSTTSLLLLSHQPVTICCRSPAEDGTSTVSFRSPADISSAATC